MRKHTIGIFALLSVASVTAVAAPAASAAEPETANLEVCGGLKLTAGQIVLDIAQFDPALGDLQSVTLTSTTHVQPQIILSGPVPSQIPAGFEWGPVEWSAQIQSVYGTLMETQYSYTLIADNEPDFATLGLDLNHIADLPPFVTTLAVPTDLLTDFVGTARTPILSADDLSFTSSAPDQPVAANGQGMWSGMTLGYFSPADLDLNDPDAAGAYVNTTCATYVYTPAVATPPVAPSVATPPTTPVVAPAPTEAEPEAELAETGEDTNPVFPLLGGSLLLAGVAVIAFTKWNETRRAS